MIAPMCVPLLLDNIRTVFLDINILFVSSYVVKLLRSLGTTDIQTSHCKSLFKSSVCSETTYKPYPVHCDITGSIYSTSFLDCQFGYVRHTSLHTIPGSLFISSQLQR